MQRGATDAQCTGCGGLADLRHDGEVGRGGRDRERLVTRASEHTAARRFVMNEPGLISSVGMKLCSPRSEAAIEATCLSKCDRLCLGCTSSSVRQCLQVFSEGHVFLVIIEGARVWKMMQENIKPS